MTSYFLVAISLGSFTATLATSYCYYDKIIAYIEKLYSLYKLINHMDLNKLSESNNTLSQFHLEQTDKAGELSYKYLGETYDLALPFKREHVVHMCNFKYELMIEDTVVKTLKHQPGLPLAISANMLGVDTIKVTNLDTGKFITYSGYVVPGYCKELIFNE